MELILIRHAEADYSKINKKENKNIWKNFAGLSDKGRKQAMEISRDKRLLDSEIILSSPYTRAVETAYIIGNEIKIPVKVEFDLREWEQEKSKQYEEEEFKEMLHEMINKKGVHDKKCKYMWENLEKLGKRTFEVIRKYSNYKKIIVVSHMMVMCQFLYKEKIDNCEILQVNFNPDVSKPNGFVEI